MLKVDPSDARPLWSQIEEGMRYLVASGALRPTDSVPSVRELAAELQVNPATVAKAYRRLVEAEVLTVRRGEGTFVAERPPEITEKARRRRLSEAARRYAAVAATLDLGRTAALDAVELACRELAQKRKEVER